MAADSDLETIASIAGELKSSYVHGETENPWTGSPFAWIRTRPSRQEGKIGELLVAEWCKRKGFIVTKSGDSECDIVINGHRVEIKLSTLWESKVYFFQQVRDQNYEYAFLLGISPFAVHGWFVSNEVLRLHAKPQHAGKAGLDTSWLEFLASNPPSWLIPFGGDLAETYKVMSQTFAS
jgi:hypothetical protein